MSLTEVNERLAELTAAGTSVWLDQIRRGMIEDGELQRTVDEDSLRGVTSNPAIFETAILGSPDYDEDLAAGAREGLSAREVYRRLAVKDVQMAADVLRPTYEATNAHDGYVSLEVAPRLAHDTAGTLEQARQYWELVDRPNLMVKIPATDEGIPAIEQGVKNPAYPATMYVYGLVGPHTVNTMPLPTLTAAAGEGRYPSPPTPTAADDPTADLDALRAAGIDLDDVTAKLLRDGIEAFIVPMTKLLDGIERKREAIVTDAVRIRKEDL